MKLKVTGALLLVGAAMLAYPFALTEKPEVLAYAAAIVLIFAVIGLATSSRVFSWCAAAALAVHYGVALSLSNTSVDLAAPALAVGWLVLLELIDLRHLLSKGGTVEPDVVRRRLGFLFLSATIGGALSATALLVGTLVVTRAPVFVLLAALLGAAILMGPVMLAAEATKEPKSP